MDRVINTFKNKNNWPIIILAIAIVVAGTVYYLRVVNGSEGCTRHDMDPKDHDYTVIQC